VYRFDSDLDLSAIVGSEIQQICCGRSDVQLRGADMRLSVQSRITLKEGEKVVATWTPEENWTSLAFQRLLMVPISGFSVLNNRLLEIQFSSGLVAHFHDDSDQYESMQIYLLGDKLAPIVV
jgi:hypothetical protein